MCAVCHAQVRSLCFDRSHSYVFVKVLSSGARSGVRAEAGRYTFWIPSKNYYRSTRASPRFASHRHRSSKAVHFPPVPGPSDEDHDEDAS